MNCFKLIWLCDYIEVNVYAHLCTIPVFCRSSVLKISWYVQCYLTDTKRHWRSLSRGEISCVTFPNEFRAVPVLSQNLSELEFIHIFLTRSY